ncbi:putative inorganic phosphate cotransporter [Microplitis mediator]|uniref:putative inorganic phosphate cotransporter n=1 Tax=Microplitis mediator TaxID=375433 RepID=UPI002554F5B9|nr:putative inorganic phosphate cotransporter [Microplitis mediator]
MASLRTITDRLTCRQVLNIMVILGFMLNYMLRVNLTIAIVAMVIPNKTSHSNLSDVNHECSGTFISTAINNSTIRDLENMDDINNATQMTERVPDERPQTRYAWDEYQVNFILGAFFWGYICTELPGGRLAEVIGAKRVFGYSMLISSIVTLLTPISATFGYKFVAGLRIILGFMLGATWPAIHPMTSLWIPPTERSKFISNMMASSLGAAITMPICGFLIASVGWESVFYLTGGISIIWSIAWFTLVYDSPAKHPRITNEERRFIEESIGTTSSKKVHAVPWKFIFTSLPVWAIIITHGCSVFGYFTVVNQLPTYFKYILNFNIKANGLLSSLPYIGKYVFALATSTLADYLRRSGKLSVTAIRKIFTTFAVLIPGLLMILQANFGCDRVISVVIFTIALTINGAVTAGYLGNGLDIAPNFSGTIFGLANTLSSLGGYLSSFMVGRLTYKNQTYHQWSIVFWILSVTYIVGAITFAIFGSGELQKWNSPDSNNIPELMKNDSKNNEEVISLNDKRSSD